jgi:GTP cyclohydrolase II
VAVERGLAEFRCGRPVFIASAAGRIAAMPVDGMTNDRLAAFRQLCDPVEPYLVITASRARALGMDATGPTGLLISGRNEAAQVLALVTEPGVTQVTAVSAGSNAGAAIELAKLAQRLPALLAADARTQRDNRELMQVDVGAIARFREAVTASLAVAAEADVPLNGATSARFMIFRDAIGGCSTAVVIGKPDMMRPVLVRLHSACLTGDVFGSRRCDCGDQLRLALHRLDEEGGGIILYLEQEGRGLGLANKIRAYKLQDGGFDTLDANTTLGFEDDERDYRVAGRMLQILGCLRVKLLTNNPAKLDGLAQAGIEIVGRIPLHGPVNADNRRYLTAKAMRAGHKLDHLLSALADPAATSAEPVDGPAE